MSDGKKNSTMILRCPVCLSRENDVPLFEDEKGFYCIKCSFTGTENDINAMYAGIRKKFLKIGKRYTMEELSKM